MTSAKPSLPLPDAAARLAALMDHDRTLLVEAGAGTGKTAIMAGRVALLLAAGVHPRGIVAITFTEAAASELLQRIERFVGKLIGGGMPDELRDALPQGLSAKQRASLEAGAAALDEIACTTVHGFCQQLIKPYPVESGIDPGAVIIDPAAAELAFEELMKAWLSARFGRDRGAEGLGRIPPIAGAGGEEDFLAELLERAPDRTLALVDKTARFLKQHRSAQAATDGGGEAAFARLADAVAMLAGWYNGCGVVEPTTGELIEDLERVATLAREVGAGPLSGRRLAELLFHAAPDACKKNEPTFTRWGRKGRWKDAARGAGLKVTDGDRLSAAGEERYQACDAAYQEFRAALGALAFGRFVREFDALKRLYRNYKRQAALLDFDDLLHHARDLLESNEAVRQALAQRYPRVLVDEFQDTDPLQGEILWRLAGEGEQSLPWQERAIRPGALFLVGDPKQAIYRFRGADVATYLIAKRALVGRDPAALVEISANFRSQPPILEFVNAHFAGMLAASQGQPGFTALKAVRCAGSDPAVAAFDITVDDRHRDANGDLVVELLRREEADVVADLVRRLIGAYPIWDRAQERFRPARAGDVALLAPTGTSLWIYERALESRGIPIATQAGKGFFRRQEVQDLIAVARTLADRRDTLAFGALLRGPLVGLTEEEIADEIDALQKSTGRDRPLHLWTDASLIGHPILKQTVVALQNLARKARRTTPYDLLADAIEQLQVRAILKARHPHGAERALANVELVLEMARSYAARGISDFARALWNRWDDGDAQTEGRPDAEEEAVAIITIHSAKGLEWPIVIPINSTTGLRDDLGFLYRRRDDTVHFRIFDFPSPDYDTVRQEESRELERERIRLWYVALTRTRDLLLLPRQSERISGDWFSLLDVDLDAVPRLDMARLDGSPPQPVGRAANTQDLVTWDRETAAIAALQRRIVWRQPSRHEEPAPPEEKAEDVFVGAEAVLEQRPTSEEEAVIQGGRERGMVLHKLMEEVLTGETADDQASLRARGSDLLAQLGLADAEDPACGPSSSELAGAVERALHLPEIAALRRRLVPELRVYAAAAVERTMTLTAGIADAIALDDTGRIEAVVDWKSDVDPALSVIDAYRAQVRDYMAATGAKIGLVVFMTSGHIERVGA
jgi:ATP-dependent exoDNAse (exonuclease V) beta subunit